MNKKIKVGLAEDHVITREGLIALLLRNENISVVCDVNNGIELLEVLKTLTSRPDIILLDIDMPGMGGKETLEQITITYPEIKVIMLTQYYSDNLIIEYIRIGARSFLPKECGIKKITEAINCVYTYGHYYDDYVSEILISPVKDNLTQKFSANSNIKLSKQELKVLELLRQNKTNKEISERLYISERTVEGIRSNLMHKTGSKNLAALMVYALDNNLMSQK